MGIYIRIQILSRSILYEKIYKCPVCGKDSLINRWDIAVDIMNINWYVCPECFGENSFSAMIQLNR